MKNYGINAAFCISKDDEIKDKNNDEFLPDENVQQLIFMNKESKILKKIWVQKFPPIKKKSFALKLATAVKELKNLREKDNLSVVILHEEQDRKIVDQMIDY